MLKSIVQTVVGALAVALTNYFEQRKLREDRLEKVRLEEQNAQYEAKEDTLRRAREIRERLRTDPEYRQRVHDHFAGK